MHQRTRLDDIPTLDQTTAKFATNYEIFPNKFISKCQLQNGCHLIGSLNVKELIDRPTKNFYFVIVDIIGTSFSNIDGLVQERRNSIANALELRLFFLH